jgi:CHAD domain-containing protein
MVLSINSARLIMELDYVKLKAIKPVLAGYIRESQILMKKSDIPDEKAVHDIRVLMKKSRAVLKLASAQLDTSYIDRDFNDLRKVGRLMCSWRETSVLEKTLRAFRKDYPNLFSRLAENEQISLLSGRTESLNQPSAEVHADIVKINDLLHKTGYRIRFMQMNMIDPQILIKELELTYNRVADIYLICRNNPKPEMLHELRKKAKDFLYQLYIFRPLNPSVIKNLEKKLDSMTQSLGKFNDLVQLIKKLNYNYRDNANLPAMNELILLIREKQDKYLYKVWPIAYQIFCPGQKLVNILGFKLLVI